MAGFSLWYVSFVYDVLHTVRSSVHISIQICIAIRTHVYADPPIRQLPSKYTQITDYTSVNKIFIDVDKHLWNRD